MEPTIQWTETTAVKTSEADFLERWKLSSFFIAMQEAASTHAEQLGVGYQALLAQEMVWVLSRVKIRVFAFPRVGQAVTVRTWPKGFQQKLLFMRDFHILAEDGSRLAAASSAYVLVNPVARRVLMPSVLTTPVPDNNGISAIAEPLEKIPAVEPLAVCHTVGAGYSTVDLLGHVNNARYIDWISDCFSFEEHRQHSLSSLQVNFLSEVRPGEQVELARGAYPGEHGRWYLAGANQATGAKAFEAELRWAAAGDPA